MPFNQEQEPILNSDGFHRFQERLNSLKDTELYRKIRTITLKQYIRSQLDADDKPEHDALNKAKSDEDMVALADDFGVTLDDLELLVGQNYYLFERGQFQIKD